MLAALPRRLRLRVGPGPRPGVLAVALRLRLRDSVGPGRAVLAVALRLRPRRWGQAVLAVALRLRPRWGQVVLVVALWLRLQVSHHCLWDCCVGQALARALARALWPRPRRRRLSVAQRLRVSILVLPRPRRRCLSGAFRVGFYHHNLDHDSSSCLVLDVDACQALCKLVLYIVNLLCSSLLLVARRRLV